MAPPVNLRSASPVDVILSNYARGYSNAEMIAYKLAPKVIIPNRFMQTLAFGKESFRLLNTRRTPGAKKKRIQFGFASGPLDLYQEALEATVPIEHQQEALKVPGVDLGQGAVRILMDVEDLNLEVELAGILRDEANYGANNKMAFAPAERWSDPNSDPRKDVNEGKEAIRQATGRYPNTLTIPAKAKNALQEHPKVQAQFKYTSSESITEKMLAAYFDVEQLNVGKAVYLSEDASDDDPAKDVWAEDAILSYVPRGEGNYMVPASAYTYVLNGMPEVRTPYFDETCDSWIYPTKIERRPKFIGKDAAFLLKGVVAA